MRFKSFLILPIYFEKVEDRNPLIDDDGYKFNEDDYTVNKIELYCIDFMYETFYDNEAKLFKYTVIGVGGETFISPLRESIIKDKIKFSREYE